MQIPPQIRIAPQVLKRYRFYMQSQHWSREQIERYQDKKLIEIVRYAGKYVPYYRKLFKEIGLDTASFRGRQDMHMIPFTDKESVRTMHDEFIADCAGSLKVSVEKTSGSTGTPLQIHIDETSRVNKAAATLRAYRWAGKKPGAPGFMLKGLSESKSREYGFDALRLMVYLNSSRLTSKNCLAAARLLHKFRVKFWEGYARSFIDYFNLLSKQGVQVKHPQAILCYGEMITPEIRSNLQTIYNTQVFDYYSHAENTVMVCENLDHTKLLMEDYFYPEIVNPEGNPAEDGYGELVGTSFYNYAMPLIRYRTRDNLRLAKKQDRSFREVLEIEGRMDDHIEMPDGRKIYFAEGALGYAKGIIMAQYIQEKPGELVVSLLVDDRFDNASYPEIERGLRKRIGDSLKVSFQVVDELEKKKSGKVPFIINRIGAEKLG